MPSAPPPRPYSVRASPYTRCSASTNAPSDARRAATYSGRDIGFDAAAAETQRLYSDAGTRRAAQQTGSAALTNARLASFLGQAKLAPAGEDLMDASDLGLGNALLRVALEKGGAGLRASCPHPSCAEPLTGDAWAAWLPPEQVVMPLPSPSLTPSLSSPFLSSLLSSPLLSSPLSPLLSHLSSPL